MGDDPLRSGTHGAEKRPTSVFGPALRPGSIDNLGQLWLYLAMRRVKIAELKNRLSEHLRAVENGAEVVVMDRDRPIARIVPLPPPGRRIRLLQPSRTFPDIRDRRRSRAGWEVSSTELLLEERRER